MSIWIKAFLFTLSLVVVGFGQPFLIPIFAVMAASLGYALFWSFLIEFSSKSQRFWWGSLWFSLVQAIQLNWLTSDRYVGSFIFLVYILLSVGIGLQFGLICIFIKRGLSLLRILAIAGGWAILEWSRLFIMTGFSWSSVGLALSINLYALQIVSVLGIFGLSFWVILTNLLALRVYQNFKKISSLVLWVAACTLPFGYGFLKMHNTIDSSQKLNVLLVQTSVAPEEKVAFPGSHARALHPIEQWRRILYLLKKYQSQPVDLIVLPEAVVPYGTDLPIYNSATIQTIFKEVFDKEDFLKIEEQVVGNSFWVQAIAQFFKADVVLGLEDFDEDEKKSYNAAFFMSCENGGKQRYEKRVLVPMGEYIPFEWCKAILREYGIVDSFTPGTQAKVFESKKAKLGISICYEETYGNLMRENRLKGANLLVNVTNDVWYPHSNLPMVHFYHGRLRAVENGIPLVRACNTGFTCGVDSFGRILASLPPENRKQFASSDILLLNLPLFNYETFYSKVGDGFIIFTSFLFVIVSFYFRKEI